MRTTFKNTCNSFFKDCIYFIFRQRWREEEREISICNCLSRAPYWGPSLQPRHVPWLGVSLATLWFGDGRSIRWATQARAFFYFSNPHPRMFSFTFLKKERKGERKGKRETSMGEKHQLVAFVCTQTGNLCRDQGSTVPRYVPWQKSNTQPSSYRTTLQPLSHTGQGKTSNSWTSHSGRIRTTISIFWLLNAVLLSFTPENGQFWFSKGFLINALFLY